jgi:hypothetical protein
LRSLKSFEDGKGMQRARDGYIGLLFSTFSSAPHQAWLASWRAIPAYNTLCLNHALSKFKVWFM